MSTCDTAIGFTISRCQLGSMEDYIVIRFGFVTCSYVQFEGCSSLPCVRRCLRIPDASHVPKKQRLCS